jgi:hypothetical protein
MIRKLCFGLVLLAAVTIVACGRQVTPNPPGIGPGGAPAGYMSVFFDVSQPFNFSNYQYWIVFNTSGNGLTPGTQPYLNNWAAYSAAIEVAGNGGSTFARAVQFVKNQNTHIPPAFITLPTTPQQLQYNANSNGSGTEFNVIFQRSVFIGVQPSPSPLAANWVYNAFTTQASVQNNLVFVDSMGAGGPNPPQYNSPALPTYTCFDQTNFALSSGLQIDPPAQIVSTEVANNPSPVPSAAATCSSDTTGDGEARHATSRM